MKEVSLAQVEGHLSEYVEAAESEEIVLIRDGKPAGVLIGFASEDDWTEYQLLNDPRFLRRVETARRDLRAGRGVRIEDLPD